MKRVSSMALSALLSLGLLAGCSTEQSKPAVTASPAPGVSAQESDQGTASQEQTETSAADPDSRESLEEIKTVAVVDVNGKQLGEVKASGNVTVTDEGIFYPAYAVSASDGTVDETTWEFYLYRPLENRTQKIGTMSDMGYETAYARTEVGNRLYTLAVTGDLYDEKNDPLWLLEFDLISGKLQQYKISDNGFAYAAMTAVNDKLLILNHDQQDKLYDKVIEFDTASHRKKEVLQHELGDEGGDTLRQLYFDGENLYLLRLYLDEDENVKAFVDVYNTAYVKQDQQNITMMMVAAAADILMPEEILQEMRQMVSRFIVTEGQYIHYENFSITHFFGDMTTDELVEESCEALCASTGSGKPLYYLHPLLLSPQEKTEVQAAAEEPEETGETEQTPAASIELLEWNGEGFSSTEFSPLDSRYYLTSASRSPGGTVLLLVEYANPEDPGDRLPSLLYYLPVKEA